MGHDLNQTIKDFMKAKGRKPEMAIAIIDSNVDALHRDTYVELFDDLFESVEWFILPSGETEKNIDNWKAILDFALGKTVRRNTPLLSIGGGVTGDLAGFAAASIMRGLPLYHFPTSLLAMVDSSIGGKTGINHKMGKNLIGAFYQPEAVFVETKLLKTLPQREWLCGLGEILKYGGIDNPTLFQAVDELVSSDNWHEYPGLIGIINTCISIKANIVQQDEKEGGIRSYLNLGHTFAHALESYTHYKAFSHGEAVFIGLIAATYLSAQVGNKVDPQKLLDFKELYGLQTNEYIPFIDDIISYMYKDKKNLHQGIRLILLKQWGEVLITDECSIDQIRKSWRFALENVNTMINS